MQYDQCGMDNRIIALWIAFILAGCVTVMALLAPPHSAITVSHAQATHHL
jgi:uncharacterized protein YceK